MTSECLIFEVLDGVYAIRIRKLNCFALRLKDGSFCLYSPVSGLPRLVGDKLGSLGKISAFLAPNHYHNKGLQEHAEAFPDAIFHASAAAAPRLGKITGLTFTPLEDLAAQLPNAWKLLEPEGLKTGEVWVEIKGAETAWIVTDAFSAELRPPPEFAEAPALLGTFPKYGVQNADQFRRWTENRLAVAGPSCLLSCHGSPVRSADLGGQITGLLNTL